MKKSKYCEGFFGAFSCSNFKINFFNKHKLICAVEIITKNSYCLIKVKNN